MNDEVQNTGHADLVEDAEGRWWAVFLGVRPVKTSNGWEESVLGRYLPYIILLALGGGGGIYVDFDLGRETFLVPVKWENDWPVFNNGQKVSLQGSAPGLYQIQHKNSWMDDFSKPELRIGWYRKSTPGRLPPSCFAFYI